MISRNMNKLVLLLIITLCCFKAYAQNRYEVQLRIENSEGKKVFLTDSWGATDRMKAVHIDSAYIINDRCTFSGTFKDRSYYSVALDSISNYFTFIIDTGKTIISGNADSYLWRSAVVANSIQNKWKQEAQHKVDSLYAIREMLQDSLFKYEKNVSLSKKYTAAFNKNDVSLISFLKSYIITHPNCYYAFSEMRKFYAFSPEILTRAKQIYPLFSNEIRSSEEGRYLYRLMYTNFTNKSIGNQFPRLKSYTISKVLTSVDLKPDFIYLIDYWASCCNPCIAALPILRTFQDRYKNKGLKIISISVDTNLSNWIRAAKKYNISWNSYCNLDGFNSADIKMFGITSVPFKILVDKTGKIIKMNPSDEDLETYFKSL